MISLQNNDNKLPSMLYSLNTHSYKMTPSSNDLYGYYVDGRNKKKIRKEYSAFMYHSGLFYFQKEFKYRDIT
jgi:hypothetical protein